MDTFQKVIIINIYELKKECKNKIENKNWNWIKRIL